ncbi:MAG: hypothetical protein IJC09_06425 [Clostridia bacterium]|nr:hypothetical protein [Clostridia bacterium]
MSKDTLSWHADDYETESERKASFDKFMNDFCDFIHYEKMVSLDEYKEQVSSFFKTVKEKLLIDCEDNEVYTVSNSFRNDIVSEYGADIYSSVFKQYENAEELIYRAEDNLEGNFEDSDEYLGEFCYWTINKYRLSGDGEYKRIFSIYQTFLNNILEIYFNIDIESELTPIEKEVYNEWLRLSGIYSPQRAIINFPYSKGDVLQISGHPYSNINQYFIYYDRGTAISRDYFDRLCVTSLFTYCDVVRYGYFVPRYLEVVDSCEDKALCNIRKMLLSAETKEIEEFIKQLHFSLEDGFEEFDKRVQKLEQQILEMED